MVKGLSVNTTKVNLQNNNQKVSQPIASRLNQDTVSFSGKNKEVNKRVNGFAKLMGDKPIPKEVLDVLRNTEIPLELPKKKNAAQKVIDKLSGILKSGGVDKVKPKLLSDVDTIAIRLNKLKILKKKEGIFRGKGEVYFITFTNDGVNEPASLKVETFKEIKKGDDLFNKGLQKPYTVYLSEKGKLPRLLDFRMLVMEEDKKESKKATEILDAISCDGEYKEVVTALTALISVAAPPVAIFTMVDSAMKIIKKVLACNEDDQLLNYAARFTNDFDNLGIGKYDNKYDNVELGYEIVGK